jgi:3-hydroxy acid dehydrogenase/malonic semialdehyde reductase
MSQKIALITGASAGIGKATALALAREGYKLILTARRADALHDVAALCGAENCHTLAFDIRDRAALTHALTSLPSAFAAIDVLVNNAGLALSLAAADEGSLEDWDTMIDTNIKALLTASRLVLPGMKARGRGHIINISSIAGTYHYAGSNVYGATKAFVTYFSLALRSDLLGAPIRVTSIEPGMVETDFSRVRFKGDDARAAQVYAGLAPLTAEDIAETVRWATAQPPHVNINRIEVMPVMQAPGGPVVKRQSA